MRALFLALGLFDTVPSLPKPPPWRTAVLNDAGSLALPWYKYTAAIDDWQIDFTTPLGGDTIASVLSVTSTAGVSVDRIMHDDSRVTFWLSGGSGPAIGDLTCIILSAFGRTLPGRVTLDVAA